MGAASHLGIPNECPQSLPAHAGLIDVPQTRLRIEKRENLILVMRFLCDVGRGELDPRVWARMNPAAFERLAEIFPRKQSGDS